MKKLLKKLFGKPGDVSPIKVAASGDSPPTRRGRYAQLQAATQDREELQLKRKMPPRCMRCKRFMGYDDGMHISINHDWKVHMDCFSKAIEGHFNKGEVLDITTGKTVKIEVDDS